MFSKLFGSGGKSSKKKAGETGKSSKRPGGRRTSARRSQQGTREAAARNGTQEPTGREASQNAAQRGAALRTRAGGGGEDATPGRASRKKPRYSENRENGAPKNGVVPENTFRPHGSLVTQPVPAVENLPMPEDIFGRKRSFAASATYYLILLLAAVGALLLLFLPIRYAVTGGAEGASQSPAEAASSAAEEAKALAIPFSTAYLDVDSNQGSEALAAQVSPFLADDLPSDVIAPEADGGTSQKVLSTAAYKTEKLRDDRWAVYTDSVVATTKPEDSGSASEDSATDSQDLEGFESSFTGADGDSVTTMRRLGLQVYVGIDGSGDVSVVAPPNVIEPRSEFAGEPGAIVAEEPQSLTDGPVSSLLEGYLAAAYGSEESRASLSNFAVPGNSTPAQPAPGLEFLGLEDGVVYEVSGPAGGDYSQVYDVEAYVSVRDPEAGTTSTQTHVLRVAETDEGWKVIGGPRAVG